MEWSAVRGERKRVLMDLDVMTQQHSPFIVQYYGSFIQDVSTGILWGRGGGGARCEHVGVLYIHTEAWVWVCACRCIYVQDVRY